MRQIEIDEIRKFSEELDEHSRNIVNTCLNEIERLRQALVEIADPLSAFQRLSKEQGCTLDGNIAVEMANSAEYLKAKAFRELQR